MRAHRAFEPGVWLAAAITLAAALAPAACGGDAKVPEPEKACFDGKDNDGNGLTDCDDPACQHSPECRACQVQTDCLNLLTSSLNLLCSRGFCRAAGLRDEAGNFLQSAFNVSAQPTSALLPYLQANTSSGILRVFSPVKTDGSTASCAEILADAHGTIQATAGALDKTTKYNVVTRALYKINWGAGDIMRMSAFADVGSDYLAYVEFWGGPPDSTSSLPTGTWLGQGCSEHNNVPFTMAVPTDINLTVSVTSPL